jgi:hypothetical protein
VKEEALDELRKDLILEEATDPSNDNINEPQPKTNMK